MPVGIINERHEPPVYYGVERPFVDTVIIPTTWFEVGAGVHGEVGRGWRYRAVRHGAAERRRVQRRRGHPRGPAEGQRGQHRPRRAHRPRSSTSASAASPPASASGPASRASSSGRASTCRCSWSKPTPATPAIGSSCAAQFAQRRHRQRRRAERRVARTTGVDPNIAADAARRLRRGRLSRRLRRRAAATSASSRATRTSTRSSGCRPATCRCPQFDRDAWVVGATYWPDPDIAIKVDYVVQRNQSTVVAAPNVVQRRPRMVVLMRRTGLALVLAVASLAVGVLRPARRSPNATPQSSDGRGHRRALRVHAVARSRRRSGRRCEIRLHERRHRRTASASSGRGRTSRSRSAAAARPPSTFTPSRPARYIFECSQLCGAGHASCAA